MREVDGMPPASCTSRPACDFITEVKQRGGRARGVWPRELPRHGTLPNPSPPSQVPILATPISERFSGGSVAKQGLSVHPKHSQHSWDLGPGTRGAWVSTPLCICSPPLPWLWAGVCLRDLCRVTASIHISRVPPSRFRLTRKISFDFKAKPLWKESQGEQGRPIGAFSH